MIERDEELISEVASGCNVEPEEVRAQWDAIASGIFVSTSTASGMMNETQTLEYIQTAVKARFAALATTDKCNLIVLGFSSPRVPLRGGDPYSELFALFPDLDPTSKIRRINVSGDPQVYKNISFTPPTYFSGVRLVPYPDGGFNADMRANFDEGTLTSEEDDYLAFVPKIEIKDISRNLAKRRAGSGGVTYEDSTDWRAITGIVVLGSAKSGKRQDGSGEWGMFEIYDGSLMQPTNTDPKITPALICWCPMELVPTDESIIRAFGPISKVKPAKDGSRPGGYSMNVKRIEYVVKKDVEE